MSIPAAYEAGADQLAALLRDYYDACNVALNQPAIRQAVLASHRYLHGLLAVMVEQVATIDAIRTELVLHVAATERLLEVHQ